MKIRAVVWSVLLLGCLWGTALGQSEPATPANLPPSKPLRRLVVIPKSLEFDFWWAVKGGVDDAARELGAQIEWVGSPQEDAKAQQKLVRDCIQRKVDGIVISPSDARLLAHPIDAAIEAGIPVVIIDSNLRSSRVSSYIATDNYEAGRMAGDKMRELLKDRGVLAMLRCSLGSENTTRRESGFESALKPAPLMVLHASSGTAGQSIESATKSSEKMMIPFRRADGSLGIDGIFCPNESSTQGMLRYLQSAGLVGKVVFIGFDASEAQLRALEQGQIQALIVQHPWKMGYTGVQTLLAVLDGKPIDPRIITPTTIITRENLQDPVIQDLIKKHRPRR